MSKYLTKSVAATISALLLLGCAAPAFAADATVEKKETSYVEKKAPAVTQDQSAQTEKPELKPATNDEVKQLIEDRKVEWVKNYIKTISDNADYLNLIFQVVMSTLRDYTVEFIIY